MTVDGRQRGFTLIEVLIALAIAGVALAACVRALGVGVNGVRNMQERSLAQQAAQNFLAEMRLQAVLPDLGRRNQPCPQGTLTFKRSEEHTSELQSLMRISYAVFCLKKKH